MRLASQRPWVKRVLIAATIVAALVGLYALAGFVAVPHVLRSELTGYVDTHYHRRLALGEIRFNPFTLTLDARDLSLPDADGTPMVGASLLHVEVSIASLWRRAASFRNILIERPFARVVVRPDGVLNLAALQGPAAPQQPASTAPAGTIRLAIDRFTVDEGQATYDDRTAARPFHTELTPVKFELRDFSTIASAANTYSLDVATTLGERFHWSGNIGIAPGASRGRFEVSALRAGTLVSLLGDALPPLRVSSGLIGARGDYTLSVGRSSNLRVELNRLNVSHLGVRPRGGRTDYVDLSSLEVGGSTFDLAQHALGVGSVRIDGGTFRIWRTPAGTLNINELLVERHSSAPRPPASAVPQATTAGRAGPAPASAAPAASAWSIAAPDIVLANLVVEAEDRTVTPAVAVKLEKIDVHVGGFRSPGSMPLDLSASGTMNGGGRLEARGSYVLDSGAARMQLEIAHLDLTALQPYLAQRSSLRLTSGLLGTKLEISRSADGNLNVTGNIGVAKLRTVDDRLRRDFVKWDRLNVEGLAYRSQPTSLAIRRIVARAPYARVIVAPDRKLNIAEAFTPGAARAVNRESRASDGASSAQAARPPADVAAAAAPPHSPAPSAAGHAAATSSAFPLPVSIGQILVQNGSAQYTDRWIEPHFTLAIEGLQGSISGMSSNPSSRAQVELDGKVDRYAPIHVSGQMNLLAATAYTDMTMTFKGVELTTATPYSAHFAGYKIEKGKISAEITYRIENGSLTANHHIVIDQLQLGEKVASADAVKLPLKLAVALLKDRNGVIDLGIPVTGSLSDPQFKLGPLIWKVVVNVVEKAAAAPFKLLGRVFGGGGEQMKYIDFDPGSADLDAPDRERLTALGQALLARPSLELDVPSAYAPELDRPALARAILTQRLIVLSGQRGAGSGSDNRRDAASAPFANPLADPAEHFRLLLAAYRSELGKAASLPPEVEAAAAPKKSRKSEAPPPDLAPAIGALEAALLPRVKVSDDRLNSLGRRRARAIQDALLGAGKIEPQRLYVLNTAPTGIDGARVRFELGLK